MLQARLRGHLGPTAMWRVDLMVGLATLQSMTPPLLPHLPDMNCSSFLWDKLRPQNSTHQPSGLVVLIDISLWSHYDL